MDIKLEKLTTLDKQVEAIEELIARTQEQDFQVISVLSRIQKIAQDRQLNGDDTPLTNPQIQALQAQQRNNALQEKRRAILTAHNKTETPESVIEESQSEIVTSYVPAIVDDGNLIFDQESGFTYVPDVDLTEGASYIVQLQTRDDSTTITNFRLSTPFDNGNFSIPDGASPADFALPSMFTRGDHGISVPPIDPSFYIQPEMDTFFDALFARARFSPQKLLISGPQGTGKTEIIRQLAARRDYNFFSMSCGMVESPNEWFGFRTVEEGEIVYKISGFIEACETPRTVILLDEFNRLHSSLQNGLYNILDDTGAAWVDLIKRNVRVASNVLFIATANIGMTHTGTFQIDSAMEDRFSFHMKMHYLPEEDEIRVLMQKTTLRKNYAERLVKVAAKIRDDARIGEQITKAVSFRQLEAWASLIVAGMRPIEAFKYTILPKYSDDGDDASEQAHVMKICQGLLASLG